MAFMIKTGTLATAGCAVLACMAAMAEVADENEELVKSDIIMTVGGTISEHQRLEAEANALMVAGNQLMQENKYPAAREKYLAALEPLRELARNGEESFAEKIRHCQKLIANCYEYQAQDLVKTAKTQSKEENYDVAIALCQQAIEVYPPFKERLEKAIDYYEAQADAMARRNQTANLLPNAEQTKRTIDTYLEQGRIMFDKQQYEQAREKFQQVLLLDPYNVKATARMKAVNGKLNEIALRRMDADHVKMMAEIQWEAVDEILLERSAKNLNLLDGIPAARHISNNDSDEVLDKMASIIIDEAEFTDISVLNAIKYLQMLSKQYDPSGDGVNIFLRLEDPAQVSEEQYMNATNPFGPARMNMPQNTFGQPGGYGAVNPGGFGAANPGGFGAANPGGFGAANPGGFGAAAGGFGAQPGGFGAMGAMGGMMPQTKIEDIKVNFTLNKQSLGEAIRYLCEAAGLKYKVDRHAVVIAAPNVAIADLETVSFPVDSEILSAFGGSDSNALQRYFMERGIQFPYGARIAYDANISRLFVTNTPENLRAIGKLVEESQQISEPLVMILARFVEVRENALKELGFNYQVSRTLGDGNNFGKLEFDPNDNVLRTLTSDTITDNVFQYNRTVNGYSLQAQVFALNQLDGQNILSAPRVTTLNGVTATISMVRLYPVPDWGDGDDDDDSDSNSGSTGGSSISTPSGTDTTVQTYEWDSGQPTFNYEEFGITLSVTPQADTERRLIQMRMNPVVTALVGWTSYTFDNSGGIVKDLPLTVIWKPITNRRAVNNYVTVADGETIVLGGMITDTTDEIDDKVPLLGDIPLVGRLFQSKSTQSQKVNLLVFLTCRLVKPDGTPFYPQPNSGVADFPAYR